MSGNPEKKTLSPTLRYGIAAGVGLSGILFFSNWIKGDVDEVLASGGKAVRAYADARGRAAGLVPSGIDPWVTLDKGAYLAFRKDAEALYGIGTYDRATGESDRILLGAIRKIAQGERLEKALRAFYEAGDAIAAAGGGRSSVPERRRHKKGEGPNRQELAALRKSLEGVSGKADARILADLRKSVERAEEAARLVGVMDGLFIDNGHSGFGPVQLKDALRWEEAAEAIRSEAEPAAKGVLQEKAIRAFVSEASKYPYVNLSYEGTDGKARTGWKPEDLLEERKGSCGSHLALSAVFLGKIGVAASGASTYGHVYAIATLADGRRIACDPVSAMIGKVEWAMKAVFAPGVPGAQAVGIESSYGRYADRCAYAEHYQTASECADPLRLAYAACVANEINAGRMVAAGGYFTSRGVTFTEAADALFTLCPENVEVAAFTLRAHSAVAPPIR